MGKLIHRQDFNRVAARLGNRGGVGVPSATDYYSFRDKLAALTFMGYRLQRRYENECSYEWANTPAYELGTARAEARAKALAAELGLNVYLQTDPRGATLYVSRDAIEPDNYNRATCLWFQGRDY